MRDVDRLKDGQVSEKGTQRVTSKETACLTPGVGGDLETGER